MEVLPQSSFLTFLPNHNRVARLPRRAIRLLLKVTSSQGLGKAERGSFSRTLAQKPGKPQEKRRSPCVRAYPVGIPETMARGSWSGFELPLQPSWVASRCGLSWGVQFTPNEAWISLLPLWLEVVSLRLTDGPWEENRTWDRAVSGRALRREGNLA